METKAIVHETQLRNILKTIQVATDALADKAVAERIKENMEIISKRCINAWPTEFDWMEMLLKTTLIISEGPRGSAGIYQKTRLALEELEKLELAVENELYEDYKRAHVKETWLNGRGTD